MTLRSVCLIGYPAEYFLPFARSLEAAGFEVSWVCALHADAFHLQRHGVAAERILDTASLLRHRGPVPVDWREQLAAYENDTDPLANDIVLMDRLVSRKDWRFALPYVHFLATSIDAFFAARGVTLVSSWRDTAMQMTAMLVARRRGIPFVVPTRVRLPQEMYGFCTAHHTQSFVRLRQPTAADEVWAEQFLRAFEARSVKPALKKASRSFADVIRLMPSHFRAFRYEARRSRLDRGNDWARYPLVRLAGMYLRRRVNLLVYQLARPAATMVPADTPYALYALHTQPESSIDVQGSFFSDQVDLIRHMARSMPASHRLFVKVHPTDVDGKTLAYYRRIRAIPGVVLLDFAVDSRRLLEGAAIVFALTGTMAYEAALMQKAVIVFARNFFNDLPTVHRCDTPPTLPALVKQLLLGTPGRECRAEIVQFLAGLRCCCVEGEVSRIHIALNEPLSPDDQRSAQQAYAAVHEALVERARPGCQP